MGGLKSEFFAEGSFGVWAVIWLGFLTILVEDFGSLFLNVLEGDYLSVDF